MGDFGKCRKVLSSVQFLTCLMLLSLTNSLHIDRSVRKVTAPVAPESQSELILSARDHQENATKSARQVETGRAYGEAYLDRILTLLRSQLVQSGFSRMRLPDLQDSFSRQVLGMKFYGSASLQNGTLEGLETIHRTGPTSVSAAFNGDVTVESKIGVDNATVTYDATAEFMGMGPSAAVSGKLSTVEALMVVRINVFSFTAELTKFDVLNTGDLRVKVDGLGTVLNFISKIIAELIGDSLKHVVLDVLEDQIKCQINDIIKDLMNPPTPLQAFLTAKDYLMKPFQSLSNAIKGK